MIRIEQVKFIPKLNYTEYSRKELRKAGQGIKDIEFRSENIWVVSKDDQPLLVVGILRHTFFGIPRLWFLLCEEFSCGNVAWNLRAIKLAMAELDKRYSKLETLVEAEWGRGLKFARFCGFTPTDDTQEVMGTTYKVMRR